MSMESFARGFAKAAQDMGMDAVKLAQYANNAQIAAAAAAIRKRLARYKGKTAKFDPKEIRMIQEFRDMGGDLKDIGFDR